jgi:hypothetical protein
MSHLKIRYLIRGCCCGAVLQHGRSLLSSVHQAAWLHDVDDILDNMVVPCAAVQQVNVVQLREKLNRRSQDQPRMAFSELLQLCIDS